jgi:hypothetical protein
MKVNFWQLLGVVLVLAGAAFWIYEKMQKDKAPDNKTPSTQPANP